MSSENRFEGINDGVATLAGRMEQCLKAARVILPSVLPENKDAVSADAYFDVLERVGVSLFIESNRSGAWRKSAIPIPPETATVHKTAKPKYPEQPKPKGSYKGKYPPLVDGEEVQWVELFGGMWPKMIHCKDCDKKLMYSESKNPDKYDPVYYRCGDCGSYSKPPARE